MTSLQEEGGKVLESAFTFAEIKLRLLALKSADKSARLATSFLTIVILVFVFIFSMVLASIALSIVLGHAINSMAGGFGIVAAFYVVVGIVLVSLRKKILFGPLLNAIVHALVGAELKAENKLEKVQDKVEDKLNLEKQPDGMQSTPKGINDGRL